MTEKPSRLTKAYLNESFLRGHDARPLRMLAEYMEPKARLEDLHISDTIVFFGSARLRSRAETEAALADAERNGGDVDAARRAVAMSRYYEDARELARRLTEWSKQLEDHRKRFVVCTGGGPGIMEAANRGASEARGINMGLNISLPFEQSENPYVTREMLFEFHYFFMRKFWFVYLAKACVAFPGGFGTLDEFFELMTLVQTGKIQKKIPIVLFGKAFWDEVLNLDALADYAMIEPDDLKLFRTTDSIDEAFDFITGELTQHAVERPGWGL